MYGKEFHPIMKMAENAMTLHDLASKTNAMNDLCRSIDAWEKIAKYTEPKLKAVDGYAEEDRVANIIVKRFDGCSSQPLLNSKNSEYDRLQVTK